MKAVFNFTVVEADKIPVNLPNRAFQYGDGLFETLVLQNGQVRYIADHYHRLTGGMAALQINVSSGLTPEWLQNSIAELAQINVLGNQARARLQVWRQPGGLYTPVSSEADFLLTVYPLVQPTVSVKEKVIFYEDVRLQYSAISSFKTCSALPYVLAGLTRKAAGTDDAILLDNAGHIAECVASNLFWFKDGQLFTPSLQTGCVEGILRKNSIRQAHQISLSVTEGLFTKQAILSAQCVFCCNVAGIQLIRQINGTVFDVNPDWMPWLLSLLQ